MNAISIEELYEKFKNLTSKELILDVRSPEEYSEGHIPGSRNIPYNEAPAHAKDLQNYDAVYVYCYSGGRAQFVCHALSSAGLKNLAGVLSGGMPDWAKNGYPIE